LDAGALDALPAGDVTLAVSSTGSDSLWLWSRNFTAAAYRPVLTLTYQSGS